MTVTLMQQHGTEKRGTTGVIHIARCFNHLHATPGIICHGGNGGPLSHCPPPTEVTTARLSHQPHRRCLWRPVYAITSTDGCNGIANPLLVDENNDLIIIINPTDGDNSGPSKPPSSLTEVMAASLSHHPHRRW